MPGERARSLPWIAAGAVLALGGTYVALELLSVRDARQAASIAAAAPVDRQPAPLAPVPVPAARTDDDARLAALDEVDPALPLAQKYASFDATLLEKARERVDAKLAERAEPLFEALFATGRVTRVRTQPGEPDPEPEGSIVRRARIVWQPYGITDKDVAELDLAQHPDTSSLWAERTWIDERLGTGR